MAVDVDTFRTPVGGLPLQASRPCVCPHPVSGRPALYVNAGFTQRIDGWNPRDHAGIAGPHQVPRRARHARLVFQHSWSDNDLVMWDNRAVLHFATQDFDHSQPRILRRTTTHGFAPPGERGQEGVSAPPDRQAVAAARSSGAARM